MEPPNELVVEDQRRLLETTGTKFWLHGRSGVLLCRKERIPFCLDKRLSRQFQLESTKTIRGS